MAKPLPEDPFIRDLVLRAQRAQLSRRTMLKGAGVGAAALTLAACSTGAQDKPKPAEDISDTDKTVRWDNWALYLDVDDDGNYPSLEGFEKQTGIKATYTEAVDDNDTYYGKVKDQLKLGQDIGCDVVCLTDWMIARWIRFGYGQELDRTRMPNVESNLVDALKNVDFDPGRKISIPWQGGFAGIAWNKDEIPEGLTSVSDLWDPSLKGRVGVLSEMRDTMGCIMQDLGTQIDGKWGDAEFTAAIDVLQKQVTDGQIRNIKGNSYKEDLVNGDTLAAIVWSGDITQLNAEAGEHWDFAVPDKGGTLWNDNFIVPIGSGHKKNAEDLINYYYDPEVAAMVAAWVNYIPPVKGAKEAMMDLDPDLADNQLIFPSDATLANTHLFRTLSAAEEQKYATQFQAILLGA
ncbi:MAG: extracellular solute-binding protein [Cryobacterium sp.]|nr:extracellular solute-binding protein [Cryobacterium sp.]